MLLWILGIVASLGMVGTVVAAIAVPGIAIPILAKVTGAILKCKACMAVLAAIALLFAGALYGVHVERQRCDARIEVRLDQARREADAAAVDRDAGVRADLEKSYGPAMSALRQLAAELQRKVDEHAKRKPAAAAPAGYCKLGDAAGVLQPPPPREPAGAARGGITNYLRRHPGAGGRARSPPGG